MKYKIISIIFFVCFVLLKPEFSHAQISLNDLGNQIKSQSQQITSLNERLNLLNEKFDNNKENYKTLYEGAKDQNDQLSNQITFAGWILALFALLFSIGSIFLVNFIGDRFEKIKEIKKVVEDTKSYIDEHNEQLYIKLKRSETKDLLKRLNEVPEDISNVAGLLLSRELLSEDFFLLKKSYQNVMGNLYPESLYMTLFMQHFPYQTICDLDLCDNLLKHINAMTINNMFERDVHSFFDGILNHFGKVDVKQEQNKIFIKKIFISYFNSKYKDHQEIKDIIIKMLIKYKLNTKDLSGIAKEQGPDDAKYCEWLGTIFDV